MRLRRIGFVHVATRWSRATAWNGVARLWRSSWSTGYWPLSAPRN